MTPVKMCLLAFSIARGSPHLVPEIDRLVPRGLVWEKSGEGMWCMSKQKVAYEHNNNRECRPCQCKQSKLKLQSTEPRDFSQIGRPGYEMIRQKLNPRFYQYWAYSVERDSARPSRCLFVITYSPLFNNCLIPFVWIGFDILSTCLFLIGRINSNIYFLRFTWTS